MAIPHFQFSSQARVDGYSCQRLSAVCTRLRAFYTWAKMSWSWKINSGVPEVLLQESADGWNGKENFFSFFVLPRLRNTAFWAAGFRRSFTLQMTVAERRLTVGHVGSLKLWNLLLHFFPLISSNLPSYSHISLSPVEIKTEPNSSRLSHV